MKTHCITVNRAGSTDKRILHDNSIATSHTHNGKEYLTTYANDHEITITILDPNTGLYIERYTISIK